VLTAFELEPSEADDAIAKKDDEDKKKDNETPTADADVKMQEADESATADADQSTMTVATTPKTPARRKSGGAAANRKSLSKKASKARITHLDAKPGDHFLVKLKGFPEWPAVICDESMLPHALITSRPVTAARPDGTYAEPYADGGKRASDRNFPVMYLSTNELYALPQ
jgi:hypothetical protein